MVDSWRLRALGARERNFLTRTPPGLRPTQCLVDAGIRRGQGGHETDTALHSVFEESRVVPVAALLNEGISESQGKDAVLVASASDLCQVVM